MTDNLDALVERLRAEAKAERDCDVGLPYCNDPDLLDECADAIAALRARVNDLQQYHDWASPQVARPIEQHVIDINNKLEAENAALRTMLRAASTELRKHKMTATADCIDATMISSSTTKETT